VRFVVFFLRKHNPDRKHVLKVNFDPAEDITAARKVGIEKYIQDMHCDMKASPDAKLLFPDIASDQRLVQNGKNKGVSRSVVPVAEMQAMSSTAMAARIAALQRALA
jgi:hypothetical protein